MRRCLLAAAAVAVGASSLSAQAPAQPATAPLRLSFADAVRLAAGEAPAVALAGLRTDSAEAGVRLARSAQLPSLDVGALWVNRNFNSQALGIPFPAQFSVPNPVPAFDNYDGRLTVTENLLDFSSRARVRAAAAGADGMRALHGLTVEAAAQVAALAYLRAARAQSVILARWADSSIAAELVTLAEAQRANGVSASLDVTRARTQLIQARGQLVVARNQEGRATIDLSRALGIDPAAPIELTDSLAGSLGAADVPAAPEAAVAAALAGRPDLAAETTRGLAARRVGSAIRAERLPQVGVEADVGYNGLTVGSALATRQLALKVNIPLLDGFGREARLEAQDAVVRESDVRERDLRQQIAAEVRAAFLDIGSADAQQAIAAEQLRLAQDELAQSRERFRAGVAGNIEVIDAQANLIRARDADIDARYAAATARVALAHAVGVARTLH